MKTRMYLALVILFAGLPGLFLWHACSPDIQEPPARAAIIDQLCVLLPNPVFLEQTAAQLEASGFKVDIFSADNITVDFYRELPKHGHRLIIFRVHSGLLGVDPEVTGQTWLYTNETYRKTSHYLEQLNGRATFAKTSNDSTEPWRFAVNAEFIEKSMQGSFPGTVIIMMGCDGLHFEDMARSFIRKGASAYIAWNASVTLDYVDTATPVLVQKLCAEGLTVSEAVKETMLEKGRDPGSASFLGYYPRQSAAETLETLIK